MRLGKNRPQAVADKAFAAYMAGLEYPSLRYTFVDCGSEDCGAVIVAASSCVDALS